MKNKIILICMLCFTSNIYASGIPVVDIAGLTQTITEGLTRANEFKQTYESAKKRLQALKDQKDHYQSMVEGHFNYKDIINDPSLNAFMANDDWKSIYTNASELLSLREEFSMTSDDPKIQKIYDSQLMDYNVKNKVYTATVERNKRMQSLLNQFSSATTPAAKEDIANSIRFEQTQIQNDAQMVASLEKLVEKKSSFAAEEKSREFRRKMFNEGFPSAKTQSNN